MKQEDKELLLKDLCGRLNSGLRIQLTGSKTICSLLGIRHDEIYTNVDSEPFDVDYVKPYLRPMLSMTEEEKEELSNYDNAIDRTDFYYRHHIDCRCMIEKGLALEAPEGMYK